MSGTPEPNNILRVMLICICVITVTGVAAVTLAEIYGKGC